MKKEFLKIAGVSSEAAFYKKYPTEEAFFAAHPEARKMAMGGTPEAFPQIATFDKAFSYGVPPGPQYLSHGGSAYPQAQTEAQFFIPIYTDVYNPYNKAMGGPNKKKKEKQAEDIAANRVYDKMILGYPTDAYDEFANMSREKAEDMSGRFSPNSGIDTWQYGNQIYDPGAYANWINKKLGRQAIMPLQKPFEGPFDITGRTPNWRNLPDQMDISEPYVDSGINYGTLTPSNPKNYLYVEPELKMGGSNVEMYPNAKTTPHWGPSNVWFQDGGQEGMTQEQPELDRLGVQNRTGAFANMLKATAAKSNARTAMNSVGMAKYGKELSIYAPGGYTVNPNQKITSNVTQQMSPTSSRYAADTPTYDQQLQANNMAYLNSMGYNPNMLAAMQQQMYGYNPNAMGNMNNFLPSLYDWNNPNQFMYRETGSPNWKFKTDIAGMGKRKGVSNIGLGEAWGLYSGDPAAREEALKKLNPSRITETPVGLFKRRMRRDYYWDPATQSNGTFKDWGTGTAGQKSAQSANAPMDLTRQNQPGPVATQSANPIPFTLQDANAQLQQNDPRARAIMNNLQNQLTANPYANTSNYGPLASGFVDPTSSAGPQSPIQSDVNAPLLAPGQQGYDPTVRTTTTSQAPSNTNSSDPNVAVKKAGPTVNQAYIDAQQSGAPYRTPVGPVVGPEGYAYGGYTGYKFGGSYNQGDVVYMTDDEIAEFVRNGGQIEEME